MKLMLLASLIFADVGSDINNRAGTLKNDTIDEVVNRTTDEINKLKNNPCAPLSMSNIAILSTVAIVFA